MSQSEPALQTEALTKKFFVGKPNEVSAVADINLTIQQGECVLLRGASGSGKTTLLTLLSCLARPTSGEYRCLGERVSRWSERFLTAFRQQHIGIVFQHFNLISGLSVRDNLSVPLLPLGVSPRAIRQKTQQAAERTQITHRLDFNVDLLSGGELQRVAIARALIGEPDLLFADEPTAHLDKSNSLNILNLFAEEKQRGRTLILTTHDPVVETHAVIDREIVLEDGHVATDASNGL